MPVQLGGEGGDGEGRHRGDCSRRRQPVTVVAGRCRRNVFRFAAIQLLVIVVWDVFKPGT